MFRILKRMPWILVGAAGMWFLDPEHGAARRDALLERVQAMRSNDRESPTVAQESLESVPDPFGRAVAQ